jgi:hypothetical protein
MLTEEQKLKIKTHAKVKLTEATAKSSEVYMIYLDSTEDGGYAGQL